MILEELKSKLVTYQKANDQAHLDVLRFLLSEIKNKEIELRPQHLEMTDELAFKVIRKQIKNRKEAIELYQKANRPDLLEKENAELAIYMEFAAMFPFELEPARPSYPQNGQKS